jgi:hypothetical protein
VSVLAGIKCSAQTDMEILQAKEKTWKHCDARMLRLSNHADLTLVRRRQLVSGSARHGG